MGILKVGVGAAQGVLADSWREYFYCDAMDVDVLAKKGWRICCYHRFEMRNRLRC